MSSIAFRICWSFTANPGARKSRTAFWHFHAALDHHILRHEDRDCPVTPWRNQAVLGRTVEAPRWRVDMRVGASKSATLRGSGFRSPLLAPDVKQAADIVAIASSFTRLRRSGSQWVGLCPLPDHNERHPSFYVHPRGVWFCHGCTRGGDVFRFVMLVKSCDFPTALNFVAGFSSCSVPLVRPPKAVEPGRRSRPASIARPSSAGPVPARRNDLPSLVCADDLAWEQECKAAGLLL